MKIKPNIMLRKIIIPSSIKIFFLAIFAILWLSSCEDVIEMELNNTEPIVVIEAKLYDQILPATVMLTQTMDFFGAPELVFINDAKVSITDNKGKKTLFTESESGIYTAEMFGLKGMKYFLQVEVNGITYSAEALMPEPVKVDSLNYEYFTGPFGGEYQGYQVSAFVTDKPETQDFAQFTVYKNSERINSFYLYNDLYTNGNQLKYPIFDQLFEKNDTVVIQMSSCDKGVYDYLYTMSNIAGNGFYSGTPYNPNTNLSNGALGYFGVFSLSGGFIIIQ